MRWNPREAYVRALVEGDGARAARILGDGEDETGFFLYTAAFLSTMLDERFGETVTGEDLDGLVRAMEKACRAADPPIAPETAADTLHGVCLPGEGARADRVPMSQMLRVFGLAITTVAARSPKIASGVGELLELAGERHGMLLRGPDD